jgi:hypothetical protein
MAKKPQTLGDEEIVTRVLAKSKNCVGWYDSKLSKERERVLNYYNGLLPARQHPGSSSYVSTDVYDAVEMMKAQLLETFSGGDEIAQFDPDQDMSADDCKTATEYASYVIFRQNDGQGVFNDVIHDGLTNRVGVCKVGWEEKYTYSDEKFEGLPHDDAFAAASQDDVSEFDATEDPATGLYSGTLTRKTDCSYVSIDAVPPEEFGIEPRAVSLERSPYSHHRTLKTKAELLEMGYDPKVVEAINWDDAKGIDMSPEAQARHDPVESSVSDNDPIQSQLQQVLLYESYVRMQIDSSKGVRLYKVCHAGGKLLDKQEVDKVPFIAYVPLPVPHVFYGNNFAARVIPVQNARTVLTRRARPHDDHHQPALGCGERRALNPKEMLENRLGGLVNVRRPDSVTALSYPNLNPFVFEDLGMLKEDKEQSTGISALSAGLNKDAISKQNSQGLVDNLVSLSGQRQKIAARNFARFFTKLMLEVIRLVILHEKQDKVVEVAGNHLTISPQNWKERKTCTVSMHLGYGEKDKAVAKHTQAYQMLAQDPQLSPMFTVQNRYELVRDTMKLAGLTGAPRYITSPDKVQPPQPDQMKVKELEIKDKQANAAMAKVQVDAMKHQQSAQEHVAKLSHEEKKMLIDALQNDREQHRKDVEVSSRVNIAEREMHLAETAPKDDMRTVVSPR